MFIFGRDLIPVRCERKNGLGPCAVDCSAAKLSFLINYWRSVTEPGSKRVEDPFPHPSSLFHIPG